MTWTHRSSRLPPIMACNSASNKKPLPTFFNYASFSHRVTSGALQGLLNDPQWPGHVEQLLLTRNPKSLGAPEAPNTL